MAIPLRFQGEHIGKPVPQHVRHGIGLSAHAKRFHFREISSNFAKSVLLRFQEKELLEIAHEIESPVPISLAIPLHKESPQYCDDFIAISK